MCRHSGIYIGGKDHFTIWYASGYLVIHSDQGWEFDNGLMESLCSLLGCTKTRTAPYHPELAGMIERFNRTCLMMFMFVNDRRDNWHMNCCHTSCMRIELASTS